MSYVFETPELSFTEKVDLWLYGELIIRKSVNPQHQRILKNDAKNIYYVGQIDNNPYYQDLNDVIGNYDPNHI